MIITKTTAASVHIAVIHRRPLILGMPIHLSHLSSDAPLASPI